jgi:FlaA1/EpsC-like NDP-sugar epimerase
MNVVEAAYEAKVKTVVALSSDKAYQPVSPYGQSKALMESLVIAANSIYGSHGPRFVVTRYGNVAGSTGSVIPQWREQLKWGRTVTVTNPDCTRFWMRADEAVDLVYKAVLDPDCRPAKPIVPDLPAFRLGDLVEALDALPVITGLPSWEKLHESMDEEHCSKDAPRMGVDELREAVSRV